MSDYFPIIILSIVDLMDPLTEVLHFANRIIFHAPEQSSSTPVETISMRGARWPDSVTAEDIESVDRASWPRFISSVFHA